MFSVTHSITRFVLTAYAIVLFILCIAWIPRQVPMRRALPTLWEGAGYSSLWNFHTPPREFVEYSEYLAQERDVFDRVARPTSPPGYIEPWRYRYAQVDKAKLGLEILAVTAMAVAVLLLLSRSSSTTPDP